MVIFRQRLSGVLIVALFTLGTGVLLCPGVAIADVVCGTHTQNQDGFYGNGNPAPTDVEGASAHVITRFGNICTGGGYAPVGTANGVGENCRWDGP